MPLSDWEPVIGMEVHVQLATRTKMFCGCSSDYLAAPPNGNVCPVCLGLPGVLPTANESAVEKVVKAAVALQCEVAEHTKFDRKNYFYPDLPKGYQISQYDLPIARGGRLLVGERTVRITRVHLEEDTGKLLHAGDALHSAEESLVDLNRAGVPLMEVVSEPDLHSAEAARDYAIELRDLFRAVGVSEADMEKGQLRAEANVSVRKVGESALGVKTELKNINSFRALQRAVAHEIERQVDVLEEGGQVVQETRGWSEAQQRTFTQRSKEEADDYRYFPEPDLPPLHLDSGWVSHLRQALPELPARKRERFRSQYRLSESDARLFVEDPDRSRLLEETVAAGAVARTTANWIIATDPKLGPPHLAELLRLIDQGVINRDQCREVQREAEASGRPPQEVVQALGLAQVSDEAALAGVIEEVIAAQPQAAADFRAGKQQAVGALLAAVKQRTGGTANLKVASRLLRDRLSQ